MLKMCLGSPLLQFSHNNPDKYEYLLHTQKPQAFPAVGRPPKIIKKSDKNHHHVQQPINPRRRPLPRVNYAPITTPTNEKKSTPCNISPIRHSQSVLVPHCIISPNP